MKDKKTSEIEEISAQRLAEIIYRQIMEREVSKQKKMKKENKNLE